MKPLGWIAAATIVALAGFVGSASGEDRVDAHVVSTAGRSVYIDAGREAGVRAGQRAIVRLENGQSFELTVQDVSARGARLELGPTDPAIDQTARIEVIVTPPEPSDTPPRGAPTENPDAAPARPVPEHPPWSSTVSGDTNTPLLAPAFGLPPDKRPMEVRGRVYAFFDASRDLENDYDFAIARAGLWLEVRNPFNDGGRFLFAGEGDYRGTSVFGGDRNDTSIRLDRLSYARGLDRDAPWRWEVGRYYSETLPEIELVDGGEAKLRLQNGWNLGAGAGFFPTQDDELQTGDDYGFYLFAEYEPATSGAISSVIGYQQTWHDGEADRNLLIGRINLRPSKQWWIYGTALVDIYGPSDTVKDSLGLTQLLTQATYTPNNKTGVGLTYTHTTWPELLREEYANLPDELLRDGRVDRVSVNAWRRVRESVRLSGRAHYWIDEDDSGYGGELALDWYDAVRKGSDAYAALYYDNGSFTDGLGLRLSLRQQFGNINASINYDLFMYTVDRIESADDSFARHSLRGDIGWSSGRWSYNLDAAYTFGDNESSVSVGAFLEYRF